LFLSFFRDENAVQAWRATNEHRLAQAKGRREIFANYRLRVAGVDRDYGLRERAQAPRDSRSVHGWDRVALSDPVSFGVVCTL